MAAQCCFQGWSRTQQLQVALLTHNSPFLMALQCHPNPKGATTFSCLVGKPCKGSGSNATHILPSSYALRQLHPVWRNGTHIRTRRAPERTVSHYLISSNSSIRSLCCTEAAHGAWFFEYTCKTAHISACKKDLQLTGDITAVKGQPAAHFQGQHWAQDDRAK